MEFTIFLPCRSGSQRIINKNTRQFANFKFGLFEKKIKNLINLKLISKIIVSTNDIKIINFLKKKEYENVIFDFRSENLCSNKATTDELIRYVPKIITRGHVIWTHVTSPFFDKFDYEKCIKVYQKKIKLGYDSLMSVNAIKKFLWNKKKPINYDYNKTKWPFTQKLDKVYEVNSAIFITHINNYLKYNNRIGVRPYLHEIEGFKKLDIDNNDDFVLAELICKKFLR